MESYQEFRIKEWWWQRRFIMNELDIWDEFDKFKKENKKLMRKLYYIHKHKIGLFELTKLPYYILKPMYKIRNLLYIIHDFFD